MRDSRWTSLSNLEASIALNVKAHLRKSVRAASNRAKEKRQALRQPRKAQAKIEISTGLSLNQSHSQHQFLQARLLYLHSQNLYWKRQKLSSKNPRLSKNHHQVK